MKKRRKNRKLKKNNLITFFPLIPIVTIGIIFYFSSIYTPSWTYNWSGIRTEIRDTVRLIEAYGDVTNGVVGYSGKTPQQWHRRHWLMKNATEQELLKLTDYPNGAVKATAYEGLLRKGDLNHYDLIIKALNDTATFFNYQNGCEGNMTLLSEYLIKNILYLDENVPSPPKPSEFTERFSEKELNSIMSIYAERLEKKWKYFNAYYDATL